MYQVVSCSGRDRRTTAFFNRPMDRSDTHPGFGWDEHFTTPLGAGIIWTRMAKSSTTSSVSSSSNQAAAGADSCRRSMASPLPSSPPPVPSMTPPRCPGRTAAGQRPAPSDRPWLPPPAPPGGRFSALPHARHIRAAGQGPPPPL